jgi:hypothetical protein
MEDTLKNKYLLMVLYLMNHYSNLRQGIEDTVPAVIEFYPQIIEKLNLDIERNCDIKLSDIETESDYLKIEKYLSSLLSKFLKSDLSSSIEDEILLLKESSEMTKEQLIPANINIDKDLKDVLSHIKVTTSGIDSWLLTPDNIRYFKVGGNENLLCTRVIHFGNVKRLLFYHMGINRLKSGYISQYHLISFFSLDYSKFEDMKNSPIRLFLFLLDTYGLELTCNNKTKKLFFRERVGARVNVRQLGNSRKMFICFQEFTFENEHYISFLYSVNIYSYLKDFANHQT